MAVSYVNSISAGANSGTAVSVSKPTGIQSGDVILAFIGNNNQVGTTDNNGSYPFTQQFDLNYASDNSSCALFYRVAGSSEPSTYNFTISTSQRWSIIVAVYRGVDTSSMFRVSPSTTGATSGTPATSNALSGMTVGDMIVGGCASDSGTSSFTSKPSGYDDRQTVSNQLINIVDKVTTTTTASALSWGVPAGWGTFITALKQSTATVVTNALFFGMNF